MVGTDPGRADMPEANRVTPFGEIVAIDQRGLFLGNRGSIHRGRSVVRPWQVRRWITCALTYKDHVAPRWEPGRWTALFFWDEAVALAAGHRPCAYCRRADFVRWMDAWESATGARPRVDPLDRVLHAERTAPDRIHRVPWSEVPGGAFVVIGGRPALVATDRLVPWRPRADGYGEAVARPSAGTVDVLTPPSMVAVLRHGYDPVVHPSAGTVR